MMRGQPTATQPRGSAARCGGRLHTQAQPLVRQGATVIHQRHWGLTSATANAVALSAAPEACRVHVAARGGCTAPRATCRGGAIAAQPTKASCLQQQLAPVALGRERRAAHPRGSLLAAAAAPAAAAAAAAPVGTVGSAAAVGGAAVASSGGMMDLFAVLLGYGCLIGSCFRSVPQVRPKRHRGGPDGRAGRASGAAWNEAASPFALRRARRRHACRAMRRGLLRVMWVRAERATTCGSSAHSSQPVTCNAPLLHRCSCYHQPHHREP